MPTPGKVTSFGVSKNDLYGQWWQMLIDARSGAHPLKVASTPSGSSTSGTQVGKVTTCMNDEAWLQQIVQIFFDATYGNVPLVTQ